jgi:hypothetical protein
MVENGYLGIMKHALSARVSGGGLVHAQQPKPLALNGRIDLAGVERPVEVTL